MWPNPQENADLFTFTDETFNGKLYVLCSINSTEILVGFKTTQLF